jgi:hypothetical protein
MATKILSEVIGTVRWPDGASGRIDGLVIRQSVPGGGYPILDLNEAIRWAAESLLWSHVPGDGRRVQVVPVDQDGDGDYDGVRTAPDGTVYNNLLSLPVWDRRLKMWISPMTGYQVVSP